MLKYRTIFVQTLAAFATASVMSCSFAANPFPSENISVSNCSQSYEGDENTDAIINVRTEVANDVPQDGSGAPAWDVTNVVVSLSVTGYRDFRIEKPTNDGSWQYGLYSPNSGTINVDVTRDIQVTTNNVAVHAMGTGGDITLKAGRDVVLASETQAVYAQQQRQISIEAGNNIVLSGSSNVVGFLGADSTTPASIELKAGNIITITAADGRNLSVPVHGVEILHSPEF